MAPRRSERERAVNRVLGERLMSRREALQWSQDRLAEELRSLGFRWTQTTVALVEKGERSLTIAEVAGLCQAMPKWDQPIHWFLRMDHTPVKVPTRQEARVAERLGLTVGEVQDRCMKLWGRSFAAEQDQRGRGFAERAIYEAMLRQIRDGGPAR